MLTHEVTYKAKQQLTSVFDKHPEHVWVWVDGIEIQVAFDSLKVDDIVVVHAGEMIPADGAITEGTATVDQHVLTGEAQPIEKETGDKMFSSTLMLSGKILFKVEKAGSETTVAKITAI